jgi:hypothetical protein
MFDEEYFKTIGFAKGGRGYIKHVEAAKVRWNGQLHQLEHKLEFVVGDTNPEIGTYIMCYMNGTLNLTGYYHDHADFRSQYK